MSIRNTFLVALVILFVIPLALFMGHSIERSGAHSAWAGVLMGTIYGACSLGVCQMILSAWEKRGVQERNVSRRQRSAVSPTTPVSLPPEHESEPLMDFPQEDQEDELEFEEPLDGRVHTFPEAQALLRGCIRKAQELPSLGKSSERFRALSLENSAIDLRRLFDALRHESIDAAIVLYSREEQRLLFANEVVRRLFGWDPDWFCQRFSNLIGGSKPSWEEVMDHLQPHEEVKIPLALQTKARESATAQSAWGLVSSGSFRGLIVGILFNS